MLHQGTVRLETERLILRRFAPADVEAVFRNFESDRLMTTYLRWQAAERIETAQAVVSDWVANYGRADFYQWAIVPKTLDEPIGTISVVRMDERVGSVAIGYCIGSRFWHQGYTSEALATLIPFFFEAVQVVRLEAQHDPENVRSGHVMCACGLQYEGTLRQSDWSNRGIVDAATYAMTRSDYAAWKNRKKAADGR